MLIGKTITDETVKVQYPKELETNPEKLDEYLAKEGLNQVSQGAFIEEAVKTVNGQKHNYGNGISTKICIFNGTGQTLKQWESRNWHGRWNNMYDPEIANGQCSVSLHVHSDGAMLGSCGCLLYEIKNMGVDVFIGWETPYRGKNKFVVQVRDQGHWCSKSSEGSMRNWVENEKEAWQERVPNDQQNFTKEFNGSGKVISCIAHVHGTIDQDSSPMLQVILSLKEFKYKK